MSDVQPSDPPLQTAQGPLGAFSYTDVGQGPVFVAVHGLPGSVRDFRHLGARLERQADKPGPGAQKQDLVVRVGAKIQALLHAAGAHRHRGPRRQRAPQLPRELSGHHHQPTSGARDGFSGERPGGQFVGEQPPLRTARPR